MAARRSACPQALLTGTPRSAGSTGSAATSTASSPGGPSRWSTERSGEWQPLHPELVVEVRYDHVSEGRFRHGTTLLRWRPDKAPQQCTFDQLPKPRGGALDLLEGSARAKPSPARKRRAGSL